MSIKFLVLGGGILGLGGGGADFIFMGAGIVLREIADTIWRSAVWAHTLVVWVVLVSQHPASSRL